MDGSSKRQAELQMALSYLDQVIQWRLSSFLDASQPQDEALPDPRIDWSDSSTPLARFIETHELQTEGQLLLLIALAPHLQPNFFDQAITASLPEAGDYPEIGGWRGKSHRGLLPTGDTVLFILGGTSLKSRLQYQTLFGPQHPLVRQQVLSLQLSEPGEPMMSGHLVLAQDYIDLFITGSTLPPHFNTQFPAQQVETEMVWDDLVLNAQTLDQIRHIETWLVHGSTLIHEWGMGRRLKPGYRALFYGPPGTGKTLTASLLGKYTNRAVYKVDLSMVVSKFIGETEKNLANLFAKAESKGWILFFDEADSLFGKRTAVRDAHDKYANQEASYLLQRVENYDGLVILATNLKSNIDDAFTRRFQSLVHFPIPDRKERLKLWDTAFPEKVLREDEIDLPELASRYELTGADILNIVQFCCLEALKRGNNLIKNSDILYAIKRELSKTGKVVT